ncbi:helix-turn-helix domain-containing protein [Streptomyces werraensis]|uniref:Helix-turn-helix domain-containing protein n=1 Tax=Streptomyces werraensis TaxID=68284 RepID=A0ABV3J964_9ACTN
MEAVSTDQVPAGERFAFWHEMCSKMWLPLDTRCAPHPESAFRAQASFSGIDLVQATLLTATPHSIHRTPKLVREADPEEFLVTCAVRGRVFGEQDDRRAVLHAGDLTLRDSSRPYLTRLAPREPTGQVLVLRFPRPLLPFPARDLGRLSAVTIPGAQGIGALCSAFLLQLARHMHEFSPADTGRLSALTLDVLIAALADALDTQAAVSPHTRQRALMAQIRAFILDNLCDPQLTPDAIAAAHHISLRYLHKLFQQEGQTVAGFIRERRLEQCRRDLANPRLAARPIHAIAARWGFTSPAHFSQAFRAAYGLSPRQYRQECTTVHAD